MRQELKTLRKHLLDSSKNQRGVALMVAIACLMLIMYFAIEVSYDSSVEYIVNSQSLNRIKSYYAAKSGMQLSLLRIKIYQQAQDKLGAQLGNSPLLDKIWQFPFAWPLPIPDEMSAVDKDAFKKIFKESTMDASYLVTIEDEGSKIDLNDLNSPSKTLQTMTKQQLLTIFEQKKKNDENFLRAYSNTNFEQLVNNIADWMSSKNESLNGGDKRSRYADLNRETQSDYFPPNGSFRTLAELNLVPGMNDEFYSLLEPRITIYGMKGINPNLATKEVLLSLDPGMTEEVVKEILKRRDSRDLGGPFKCDQGGGSADFWDFAARKGARLMGDPKGIPITCDTAMNFKIRSTGSFAGAAREITAIVLDLNRAASKIKTYVDQDKKSTTTPTPTPGGTTTGATTTTTAPPKDPLPKGPPRIVYWSER